MLRSVFVLFCLLAPVAFPQGKGGRVRPQPQPETVMTGDFSVSGTVVDGSSGEPVRRAEVTIYGGGVSPGSGSMLSDNSGTFRFSHLEPGTYQIRAMKSGYSGQAGRSAADSVTVNAANPNGTVTCKVIKNGAITGKVLDENNEPLANAMVQVLRKTVRDGHREWSPVGGAPTNDLGEYRQSVQPGQYLLAVTVNQPGRQMFRGRTPGKHIGSDIQAPTYPTVYYPNAKESSAGVPIKLGSGEEQRADFTLMPSHAVQVSGHITNMTPNRGMGISLGPAGGDAQFRRLGAGAGPDGSFTFTGVLPGRYTLMAESFNGPNERWSARVPLTVGDADVADLAVTLVPAFEIPVTVRASSGTEAPPNVEVQLTSNDKTQMAMANTGNENMKSLKNVTPGSYRITARSQGAGYVKSVMLGGVDVLDQVVDVSGPPGNMEVVVAADGGTVSGEVVRGEAPARAQVVLLRKAPGGNMVQAGMAQASEAGHFSVANLPPGEYEAFAMDDVNEFDYAEADTLKRYQDYGQSLTVQEKSEQQVKLKVAPSI